MPLARWLLCSSPESCYVRGSPCTPKLTCSEAAPCKATKQAWDVSEKGHPRRIDTMKFLQTWQLLHWQHLRGAHLRLPMAPPVSALIPTKNYSHSNISSLLNKKNATNRKPNSISKSTSGEKRRYKSHFPLDLEPL